jgi:phosphoserine phosphatase
MIEAQPSVWPISDLVIFDCDSTLSSIEGIDELAGLVARESEPDSGQQMALNVAALTKRAMEGDVPLEAVYGLRLGSVNPTQSQVNHIASIYRQTAIPDGQAVIKALQTLGVQVFVVSGGLIEPVRDFGTWLGVPAENISAVDMEYDQLAGKWWRYWEQPGGQNPRANYLSIGSSPLTGTRGKNRIVAQIRAMHPGRAMMVGDGLSDLEASEEVDLFVGFGGAVYRQRVAQESPVYITSPSLAPILPLALGSAGNVPRFAPLWSEGLRRIYSGDVQFRNDLTREAFLDAVRRNHPYSDG